MFCSAARPPVPLLRPYWQDDPLPEAFVAQPAVLQHLPHAGHVQRLVEGDDGEDNKVIEEFEIGYLLNGRLLRPAKVSVSRRTIKSAEGEGRG